jgi:hypothetical protein
VGKPTCLDPLEAPACETGGRQPIDVPTPASSLSHCGAERRIFFHDSEHHDVPEFLTREITGEVERRRRSGRDRLLNTHNFNLQLCAHAHVEKAELEN